MLTFVRFYSLDVSMLVVWILLWQLQNVDCLDCYQCDYIHHLSDCHHVVQCGLDQHCHTDTSMIGGSLRFTLGCRDKQICLNLPTDILGRSVARIADCSQCCNEDTCNKKLCASENHIGTSDICQDDPDFRCEHISSAFSICNDLLHAKVVCRKFCGLCDLADGQWSDWKSWSVCDHSCGNGTRSRTRSCDNPAPRDGGLPCVGANVEHAPCHSQCSGMWGPWTAFSSCSVTCGIGIVRRSRQCVGTLCVGDSVEDQACFTKSCVDAGWSSWSGWSSCTASCLGGLSHRYRTCDNPPPSALGLYCMGESIENKICNTAPCPDNARDGSWSSWSTWSTCSTRCSRTRSRSCTNPPPSGSGRDCVGNTMDRENCEIIKCAVPVRLVNGSHPYEGRLEIHHSGEWGTVCQDSFTDKEAKIVCRMLKYPSDAALAMTAAGIYGSGTLPILLDDVSCVGNEQSIVDCSHRDWGKHDCSHDEDVAVSCIPNFHIRLAEGTSTGGRVEVSLDGSNWGSVCNDLFGDNDNGARVVCRMLGLPTAHARYNLRFGNNGAGEAMLDDVSCTGSETSLLQCDHLPWGMGQVCGQPVYAGVTCS